MWGYTFMAMTDSTEYVVFSWEKQHFWGKKKNCSFDTSFTRFNKKCTVPLSPNKNPKLWNLTDSFYYANTQNMYSNVWLNLLMNCSRPDRRSSMKTSSKRPSSARNGNCLFRALPGRDGTTIWRRTNNRKDHIHEIQSPHSCAEQPNSIHWHQ